MERLSDIGEDALIDRLVAGLPLGPDVVAGPGDDCAVIATHDPDRWELLKTDCLVEGVHFTTDTEPEKVGWKALCRSLSDIAAMGGDPRSALVTLAVPARRDLATVEGWYRGLRRAAERFGVSIVGGETSSLPDQLDTAFLSVTVTGTVWRERCLFRSGARNGDLIAVTGRLGGSFASGRHLDFVPRLREGAWLANADGFRPTAMMDLSDGLAKDLPRLAKASGDLGWRLDLDALPCHPGCDAAQAIGDGEDYELLMTLPPQFAENLLTAWETDFPDTSLTLIGEITPDIQTPLTGGWDHFKIDPA
ncbi:MAG: thiamine-phosphate kinase [Verrucomicrobiae bacterium]|nr:thiamine-phosphate kinase [Verrucomicrobiae bacterium]